MRAIDFLRKEMRGQSLEAVAVFRPESVFALIGAAIEEGCCIIEQECVTLIAEAETQQQRDGVRLLEYQVYGFEKPEHKKANQRELLSEALKNIRKMGTDTDWAPMWLKSCVEAEIISDVSALMERILRTKPEDFVGKFAGAAELNHAAYAAVAKALKPGMTGPEIYSEICRAEALKMGGPVNFKGDFLVGADTAGIAGFSSERAAQTGDAVIVDLLSAREGAYCDTTRTFFLGQPDDEHCRAYNAVVKAIRTGEEMLRPGVIAENVYKAVSASLEGSGYSALPHHAGHGVGYSWYEPPYFIPNCRTELEAGMIVTLEPGVYINGRFGVRIENNYLIHENGCKPLFDSTLDIENYTVGGE